MSALSLDKGWGMAWSGKLYRAKNRGLLYISSVFLTDVHTVLKTAEHISPNVFRYNRNISIRNL